MRGTGEGQRGWDLSKSSKMTNGSVGTKVNAVDGDTLDIIYKGGSSKIRVSATQVRPSADSSAAVSLQASADRAEM